MLMVRVHFGGEIRQGRKGAEYTESPRFTLMATSEQGWHDVKGEIYRQLGYSKSEYNLKTLARVNVVPIVGSMQSQLFIDSVLLETQPEPGHTQYSVSQAGPSLFELYQTQQTPRLDLYLSPYPDVNDLSPPVQADMGWTGYNNQDSP
ncbi:hypothetical protein FCM35_KLT22187 [Carex littledalei]|uniref:Uncharacterized protein n=1 Tax=Carex littledalei TaxID=544730 RepID=A0A833QKS0_9POAL|nr:hypothetical protein FCM35_KLT22187 [Carex littledalei]